jgi:hypothetical protein
MDGPGHREARRYRRSWASSGRLAREVDSPACGVFGRFLDIRTDADEMHCPALADDRALEILPGKRWASPDRPPFLIPSLPVGNPAIFDWVLCGHSTDMNLRPNHNFF